MSRYLVVTHQTALSPELHREVGALIAKDPAAEFAILVPEAHEDHHTWEGEEIDVAGRQAEAAAAQLTTTVGARVVRTATGVSDPLQAIADELAENADYTTLVICTLPLGVSRWLRRDIVHHAARKFGLPIVHVVAGAHPA
jgi:hypothetical protein